MKLSTLLAVCAVLTFGSSIIQAQSPTTPAELGKMAADYYQWRNENFLLHPVMRACTPGTIV
jgi:hypothetical protein